MVNVSTSSGRSPRVRIFPRKSRQSVTTSSADSDKTTSSSCSSSADSLIKVEFRPCAMYPPATFQVHNGCQLHGHEEIVLKSTIERNHSCPASSLHSQPRNTAESVSSYEYQQSRLVSLGNFFRNIHTFFQNNPTAAKMAIVTLAVYMALCSMEVILPKIVELLVRTLYPSTRYCAIALEHIFGAIANLFTRADHLIHATYCDFATKWCHSHRLMCDVKCSFVEQAFAQARPQLVPPPQF